MTLPRNSLGLLGAAIAFSAAAHAQDLGTVTTPGAHIQRTMKLLADSTPDKRNAVRVLFYGQSITCQPWWREVAADLKERFPNADLTIKNHGIGGFTAPSLLATTEYDLFPFYPDLLIFHVYGGGDMGRIGWRRRKVKRSSFSDKD